MVVGDSEYFMIAQDKVMLTTLICIEHLNIIKISWPLMCRGVCMGWAMMVSEHSSAASNTS